MSINQPTNTRFPKTWRFISNARKSVSALMGYKKAPANQQDAFVRNNTAQSPNGMSNVLRGQMNSGAMLLQQSRETSAQATEDDYLALPEAPTHKPEIQGGLTGASLPRKLTKQEELDAQVARILQEAEEEGDSGVIDDFADGLRGVLVEQAEDTKNLKASAKELKGLQESGKSLVKTAKQTVTFAEESVGMSAVERVQNAKARLVAHNAKLVQQRAMEVQKGKAANKQQLTALRNAIEVKNQLLLETLAGQEQLLNEDKSGDIFAQVAILNVARRLERRVNERIAEQQRFLPKVQKQ